MFDINKEGILGTVEASGVTVQIIRKDPFGLIYLSIDNGQLPEKYRSAYTTLDKAELAARHYADERAKVLQEIKENIKKSKKAA